MVSPFRAQLVNKSTSPRTGIGRYAVEIERGLRERDIELRVAPLRRPLPRAAVSLGRRAGYDLDVFFHSYPLRAGVLPGYITHLTSQTLGILLLTQRLPRPIIVTVHDIFPYLLRHNPELCVYRHAADRLMDVLAIHGLRRADRLIAVSHYTKRTAAEALRIPSERIQVVHEAVDLSRFHPCEVPDHFRREYGLNRAYRYVLYVGSNDPRKNLFTLVKVFSIVNRHINAAKLLLVGQHPFIKERGRLLELISELGLVGAVHFIEHIPDNDLPYFYNISDITISLSLYEGFGLPILEAMGCARPVIVSDRASLPEVVSDSGIIVDPNDVDQVAGVVTQLLQDGRWAKSVGDACRNRALSFRMEMQTEQTISAYIASAQSETAVRSRQAWYVR